MATIQGPAAATQSGAPPTFQVDPSPNQFYAYEVATDAALFAAVERGTERTPANFYASWQAPRLTAAPTVQLPTTVWQRFAQANRLYYRVWTSAAETEWVNALTTTPDAEAHRAPFVQLVSLLLGGVLTPSQVPLEEIWSVATGQETIGTVTAAGECQAAIGWHMFSPKRPIAPQAAEWVVIVTTQPTQPDAPIATGMVRLAPQTLEVKATQHFQDPPAPVEIDARILPGRTTADMVAEIQSLLGDDIVIEVIAAGPKTKPTVDTTLFDDLSNILTELDPTGTPIPYLFNESPDGRLLEEHGIQNYGFLPMDLPADIDLPSMIHGANERVPTSSITFGAAALYRLIERY